MSKLTWRGGNMLYPVPPVLVSCGCFDPETGMTDPKLYNVLTIAWTGTICSTPAMAFISVRPERHSYSIIKESGEFVINLPTRQLVEAVDYAGVRSGKDEDKFARCGLTPLKAKQVRCPLISESPVNLECKVTRVIPLGTHDMFLAEVVAVHVDEALLDANGKLDLAKADLLTYSHGEYFTLGDKLGSFGYSVKKTK
ncbi:MAG: flavin reductase family protein [Lachnospiraceae bacterium]|nr:flavin reductase family protein [Lachnospiraceae bacterium]